MNERRFGQLRIRQTENGTAVGVPGELVRGLESTAEAVAEFVRTDDGGRYRPLSGAKTLPTAWEATIGDSLTLDDALEAVYPLSTVHQQQLDSGTLRVVTLEEVFARQSGRYEETARLSSRGRAQAVQTLCAECVRQPVWAGQPCGSDDIPCPEPCSVFVALCREAVLWEANPPTPSPPDPAVPWAAFDEPGNELRERYLSRMLEPND